MNNIASRPLLSGEDLDTAVDRARAELAALLRGGAGGAGDSKTVTEARALLSALLDRRVTAAAARMDERDAAPSPPPGPTATRPSP